MSDLWFTAIQLPLLVTCPRSMCLPLVLMIGIFYFLILRPEKKRNKEMQQMLNNIQVADEVVTSGGIIGRVLSVKEDTVLIETGSDRTKIRVLKSAIARNNKLEAKSITESAIRIALLFGMPCAIGMSGE